MKKSELKDYSKCILSEPDTVAMRLFSISNVSDSLLLRHVCKDIKPDSTDEILRHLISRMYVTVSNTSNPGVGIAAPQVGISKRIIWVQRFDKPDRPFEVYFNAKIKQYSKLKQGGKEACLSVPETVGNVCRSYAILVEYDLLDGNHYTEMVEGFTAIIFQHEIDHLNGKLFVDYSDEFTKEMSEEEFKTYCQKITEER